MKVIVLKIDWVQHYKEILEQIDKEIKAAIYKKAWNEKKILEAERKRVVKKISELEAE